MNRFFSFDKGLVLLFVLFLILSKFDPPSNTSPHDYKIDHVIQSRSRDSLLRISWDKDKIKQYKQISEPLSDSCYEVSESVFIGADSCLGMIHHQINGSLKVENIRSSNSDLNFWTSDVKGDFFANYLDFAAKDSGDGGGFYTAEFVSFQGHTDINSCTFENIQFMQAETQTFRMYNTICKQMAWVEAVNFNSDFHLVNSVFDSSLVFTQCSFDDISIEQTKINGVLVFESCTFNKPLIFNRQDSIYQIIFRDCQLPPFISFVGEQFLNEQNFFSQITFEGLNTLDSVTNSTCFIEFPESFKDKVGSTNINYINYNLWFPTNASYEYKSTCYLNLLNHFKNIGYTDSYEALDKEYQQLKYFHEGLGWIDLFNRIWWDYGYNKLKVIVNSLWLWAFFCFLNIFLFVHLNNHVYPVKFKPLETPNRNTTKRSSPLKKTLLWVESGLNHFGNSVIYTSALFFGLKMELDRFKSNSALKLYVLSIYCLGLFCVAYIVNIIIVR
jgi:hypothetical protein